MARAVANEIPIGERRIITARLGLIEYESSASYSALGDDLGLSFAQLREQERDALEVIRSAGEREERGPAAELIGKLRAELSEATGTRSERAACLASAFVNVPTARAAVALLYLSGATWEDARRLSGIAPQNGFERLLSQGVIWPRQGCWEFPQVDRRLPRKESARTVRGNRSFSSHKMENDVACESGLEYRFYEHLDGLREILMYWEQPAKVDLPGKGRWPYHPDSFVAFRDGRCFLAEVKPAEKMALYSTIEKFNALARKCEVDGIGVFLGNHREVVQELVQADPAEELRRAVLDRIAVGPMDSDGWAAVHTRLRAPILGLRSIVLQEHLWFDLEPFCVRRPTPREEREIAEFTALARRVP